MFKVSRVGQYPLRLFLKESDNAPSVGLNATLGDVVEKANGSSTHAVLVTDPQGGLVGIFSQSYTARAVRELRDFMYPISKLRIPAAVVVSSDVKIDDLPGKLGASRVFVTENEQGKLVLVDRDDLAERIQRTA